jgi:hypothetical protein
LAAVLWFDLMFDVQVRGHVADVLPEQVRTSIATYYARVTTAARPMNRLVLLVMLTTIGALLAVLFGDDLPNWRAAIALVLTLVAVNLAGARTVPAAVRLGAQGDDAATQSRLARGILRDHVVCITAIAATLLLGRPPGCAVAAGGPQRTTLPTPGPVGIRSRTSNRTSLRNRGCRTDARGTPAARPS